MEKRFYKISRSIFWGILGLISAGVLSLGVFSVWNHYEGGRPLTQVSNSSQKWLTVAISKNVEEDGENKIESGISAEADARPVIIEKYLKKYNSPLLPYSKKIFELSQKYGFEYYWIVAIAQQESNLCKKIPEDSHNCWGYGIHSQGTLKFENYDLALESYAAYLKKQYFDKGLNTPELIMGKYCPHSNGSWARGVQQFIDEMESGKKLNK